MEKELSTEVVKYKVILKDENWETKQFPITNDEAKAIIYATGKRDKYFTLRKIVYLLKDMEVRPLTLEDRREKTKTVTYTEELLTWSFNWKAEWTRKTIQEKLHKNNWEELDKKILFTEKWYYTGDWKTGQFIRITDAVKNNKNYNDD